MAAAMITTGIMTMTWKMGTLERMETVQEEGEGAAVTATATLEVRTQG